MKCEERNTDGKNDFIDCEMGAEKGVAPMRTNIHHLMICSHQGVERVGKEVSIFEIEQNAQVHNHTRGKPELTPTFMFRYCNLLSNNEVPQRSEKQKQKEEICSLVIEEHARHKQEGMANGALLIDNGIYRKHYSEENPKYWGSKNERLFWIEHEELFNPFGYQIKIHLGKPIFSLG